MEAIQQFLARIVSYFMSEPSPSADYLRRIRLFLISHLGLICAAVFFAFLGPLGGENIVRPVLGAAALLAGINPFLYRRFKKLEFSVSVLIGIFYLAIGSICIAEGGIQSAALLWVLVPPLLGALLTGPRQGILFCGVMILEVSALYVKDFNLPDPGANRLFTWLSLVLIGSFLTFLAAVFEAERAHALMKADQALSRVNAMNSTLNDDQLQLEQTRSLAEKDAALKTRHLNEMKRHSLAQDKALSLTVKSIGRVSGVSETLSDSVLTLGAVADQSRAAVDEMSLFQQKMQQKMTELVDAVEKGTMAFDSLMQGSVGIANEVAGLSAAAEETSVSMAQMEKSLLNIKENTTSAKAFADSMIAQAVKGASALQETSEGMNEIRRHSELASEIIRSLSSHTDAIGDVLGVIDEVAHQTGLLSLNAAILAAQAGENGQGFSVVADEIKNLSILTGNSTKEIAARIYELQAQTQRAVLAIGDGERAAHKGVELTKTSIGSFENLVDAATHTSDMVSGIASATLEQTKGTQVIARASEQVADTVAHVAETSRRHAEGAEVMRDSAKRMIQVAQHVEASTERNHLISAEIVRGVRQISEMVHRLNEAQQDQHSGSEEVFLALEAIREAQEAQIKSLTAMQKRSEIK